MRRHKATALAEAGDRAGALAAVRAALALDSANDDARLDLAQLLLEIEATPSAEAIADAGEALAKVAALTRQTARFRALQTRVDSLLQAARLPAAEELPSVWRRSPLIFGPVPIWQSCWSRRVATSLRWTSCWRSCREIVPLTTTMHVRRCWQCSNCWPIDLSWSATIGADLLRH